MKNHRGPKQKKNQQIKRKNDDSSLVLAAQNLVSDDVNLSIIPDSDLKEEFLELAELAIHDKINSLQKARLEFLSNRMEEIHEQIKNQKEIDRQKQEAQRIREKKEKNRRLLRMKTKRGQPILKNLARIQYQQVKAMIESEKRQSH
ncbi:hypothetical protein M9Y10_012549 [Tritrichomonas musculus]|uniref:Uncharacterized protein n=1 Tax=Tritrichomonas musculus TaxID=1915356 RepID=A0ABR2IDK6_9EUKA